MEKLFKKHRKLKPIFQALYSQKKVESLAEPVKCCREGENANNDEITFSTIREAHKRIKSHLEVTPLTFSKYLSEELPGNNKIYLKEEQKHMTGSFKERGALNALLQLSDVEKKRGVICMSAGNHGQATTYWGKKLGIDVTVCMPKNSPIAKIQGTERYNGKVVLYGDNFDEAGEKACSICRKNKHTFVHPFDDPPVISGQGTLGLELMEQNPYLDTVIIPIGGGGLIAGVAKAIKTINPRIQVIGVEARNVPSMHTSIKQDRRTMVRFAGTIADGIAVKVPGNRTFPMVKKFVDDIVTVSENDLANAVLSLLEREKLMVEGAGGAAVATLLNKKLKFKNKTICSVLSGGNIDVTVLKNIISRGLAQSGRLVRVRAIVKDIPGMISALTSTLYEVQVNISHINHDRSFDVPVGYVSIVIIAQTRGFEHSKELESLLKKADYIYEYELRTKFQDSKPLY